MAGHYLVGGQVETAIGTGQFLVGSAANAHTADLQVRVTMTPAQVGIGVTSDVVITRGLASEVDLTLTRLLDPVTGRMKTINDGFQTRVDDIKEEITRQNALMAMRRERLLKQFIALESTVSQLQNLGAYLTTQLAQISSLSAGR